MDRMPMAIGTSMPPGHASFRRHSCPGSKARLGHRPKLLAADPRDRRFRSMSARGCGRCGVKLTSKTLRLMNSGAGDWVVAIITHRVIRGRPLAKAWRRRPQRLDKTELVRDLVFGSERAQFVPSRVLNLDAV